jgi:hypothetical protein
MYSAVNGTSVSVCGLKMREPENVFKIFALGRLLRSLSLNITRILW